MNQIPGFPGFFSMATQFIGLHTEDPSLLARYEALAKCGEGTLGRAFYDHYVENGFPFPGAKHGTPEIVTFHDIGHLFSGYGVDPQGEIQQAAFQAGFARNDGFVYLLFGILQFHVGMRLTPIAKSERGYFDVARVMKCCVGVPETDGSNIPTCSYNVLYREKDRRFADPKMLDRMEKTRPALSLPVVS